MRWKLLPLILLLVSVAATARAAADEAPPWLQQAAKLPVPTYEKDVPAVVLQDEQHVTVSEDGRIVTVNTFAFAFCCARDAMLAKATEFYQNDAGKVRELKAWLIRPTARQEIRQGRDDRCRRRSQRHLQRVALEDN